MPRTPRSRREIEADAATYHSVENQNSRLLEVLLDIRDAVMEGKGEGAGLIDSLFSGQKKHANPTNSDK